MGMTAKPVRDTNQIKLLLSPGLQLASFTDGYYHMMAQTVLPPLLLLLTEQDNR